MRVKRIPLDEPEGRKGKEKREMATQKFEVRHTGRPFGPAEMIEDRHFKRVASRHATLSAARKAVRRYRGEMAQHCGPSAWDNHYAIFALKATSLRATNYCYHCHAEITRTADWPAGTREPWIEMPRFCSPECERADNERYDKRITD
jgi:hypothetical protein